jgi:hypothetical protein
MSKVDSARLHNNYHKYWSKYPPKENAKFSQAPSSKFGDENNTISIINFLL